MAQIKPSENIERKTVLANLARSRELEALIDSWQRHTIVALLVQINLETAHIAR